MSIKAIHVLIDVTDLYLDKRDKLQPIEQVDFAHQTMLTLNRTTAWVTGRVRLYLHAHDFFVEVSPALRVSDSPKEFKNMLKDLFRGYEPTSGSIKLMTIKPKLPHLPENMWHLNPYAQKVIDPATVVDKSFAVKLSMAESKDGKNDVCLSRYPLSPMNQLMSAVTVLERSQGLE